MADLFEQAAAERSNAEAPLASRMRPRTLDDFVGQEHIVGPGKLLRRAIESDRLFSSLILWGPPGTGKTTLAKIIAQRTSSHFETLNAVMAGIADIRRVVAEAKERRRLYQQRTILLVDEIHRFNKSQQDGLLPHVEDGTIILIGATTENPYFEVNSALLSRSRLFQLNTLTEANVREILRRALSDPERGYGERTVRADDDALAHLAHVSSGDARNALNALELAVESTPPAADGSIHVDLATAQDSIQRRAVLYDKEGDAHYDTISAFIKSVRGSDPDAALYWLAKMVYAGEDPRFIIRRLLILSGEDIGLADPMGIVVAASAAQAFDYMGMPEGIYPIVTATLYLATAPKATRQATTTAPAPRSNVRVPAMCLTIYEMPAATKRWATAKATSTRTKTRPTMCRKTTCPRTLPAWCSTRRPMWAMNMSSPSGWSVGVPPNDKPWASKHASGLNSARPT